LRKLQKQNLREVDATQDFVAQLSSEILLERVEQTKTDIVGKTSRGMLLYERDTGLYDGLEGSVSLIDQVPFNMVRSAPEQLRAMLVSEQYSLLLSNSLLTGLMRANLFAWWNICSNLMEYSGLVATGRRQRLTRVCFCLI